MRDVNRIDTTLAEIGKLWKKYPDWRFMQLMCNFQRYMGSDCFYMEENKLVEKLKEFVEGA